MKVLLTVLTLALAAMAIPTTSAALPIQCTYGPTTPGGDTHCEGSVAKCDVLVHMYDQEDALNRYQVDCSGCGVSIGGGSFAECDLIGAPGPMPMDSAVAAGPDLIETHCVNGEDGAYCSTTVAGTCTLHSTPAGPSPSSLSCSPPSSASADIGPEVCQTGIAQTWCDVEAGPCDIRVTPWTAWGDVYVVADCRTGGAGPTCHTEVHAQGPLDHEHWCAF